MELFRALGALIDVPGPQLEAVADALELGPLPARAEHTELFGFQLYPYASVYLGPEGMMGGLARERIAGFHVALKRTPPPEPDHLTDLLVFYAWICKHEAPPDRPVVAKALEHVRKAYLWEHMLSWLPPYLQKVREIGPPFYQEWAKLLYTVLVEEAQRCGDPAQISAHLLETPELVDPREASHSEFFDSILTPVRSGIILTRADLLLAAREFRLGVRIGERKFILNALFEQDPNAMLSFLTESALWWAENHRQQKLSFGTTANAWLERSEATARLLIELQHESMA
jgi:TorA maturation chaperone TorD